MKKLLLLLPFLVLGCTSAIPNTITTAHLDVRVADNKPYHSPYYYPYIYSPYSSGGRYGIYGRYGGPRHTRDLEYIYRSLNNNDNYRHKNRENSYKRLDKRHEHRYNKYHGDRRNGFRR